MFWDVLMYFITFMSLLLLSAILPKSKTSGFISDQHQEGMQPLWRAEFDLNINFIVSLRPYHSLGKLYPALVLLRSLPGDQGRVKAGWKSKASSAEQWDVKKGMCILILTEGILKHSKSTIHCPGFHGPKATGVLFLRKQVDFSF